MFAQATIQPSIISSHLKPRHARPNRKKEAMILVARLDNELWPAGEGERINRYYRNGEILERARSLGFCKISGRSIDRFYAAKKHNLIDDSFFADPRERTKRKSKRRASLAQYDDTLRAIVATSPGIKVRDLQAELRRRTGFEAERKSLYHRLYALGLRKRIPGGRVMDQHRDLIQAILEANSTMTAARLHSELESRGVFVAKSTVYKHFPDLKRLKSAAILHVQEIEDQDELWEQFWPFEESRTIPVPVAPYYTAIPELQ